PGRADGRAAPADVRGRGAQRPRSLNPRGRLDTLGGRGPSRESEDAMATIDVRADIAAGREPFARIMAAVQALGPDEALELVAPFEPEPLYDAMAQRGFTHDAVEEPGGVWRVTFRRKS